MDSDSSQPTTNSVSTFLWSAIFNLVIFVIFVVGFLILRPHQKRIYQGRSTIDTIPQKDRPRPLKSGIFAWFQDLVTRPESEILEETGLDGYFFLRYLRFNVLNCIAGIVILFPILLSINATGGNDQSGFDILSFTNVKGSARFWAYAFLAWLFIPFVLFQIYREYVYYISVRQAVLTSPAYKNLLSSRTVLIQTLPDDYLDEKKLRSLFDGVKYVWINRVQKKLVEKVEERDKLAMKVENAEVSLLKTAIKNRFKSEKKKNATPIEGTNIDAYVPEKKRPTHRLKFLIGEKVDTINYGKEHIPELNGEIKYMQDTHKDAKPLNSAFLAFHTQEQAEVAVQVLVHHQALHMAPRYIGIRPEDIVWVNLRMFWWERLVRSWGALLFIIALIVFWSFPVAFVGLVSNLKSLQQKVPFLHWLDRIPEWAFGAISGILPTVMLAVLMALLPIVLRLMAKISGCPSIPFVEYYVQNAYFGFQVVQVFLVVTLASSATSVVPKIVSEPTSAMNLLASQLPKASNFYISYFLLQGLSIAGGALIQIVALVLLHVMSYLLDSTPRKKWTRWNFLGSTGWGTVFPIYTNLAVISITYAMISPIILCFSGAAFILIYLAYLHNLIFTVSPSEGRGIYYPRALTQTFVGIYIGEVCLLGLFVFGKAWGPVVFQALLIAATVFVQVTLKSAFHPMLFSLPRDLVRDNSSKQYISENTLLLQSGGGIPLQDLGQNPEKHQADSLSEAIPTTSQSRLEEGGYSEGLSHRMSVFGRFFKPHMYLTPQILQERFLGPKYKEPSPIVPEDVESLAYAHPCVSSTNPVVWIPKDPYGLSDIEVESLRSNDVNATNQGAWFEVDNEKKKIKTFKWSEINEIPIYEKPAIY